jgi:hypothetical protein
MVRYKVLLECNAECQKIKEEKRKADEEERAKQEAQSNVSKKYVAPEKKQRIKKQKNDNPQPKNSKMTNLMIALFFAVLMVVIAFVSFAIHILGL